MRIFSQKIEAELIPHWLKKKKNFGKIIFFHLKLYLILYFVSYTFWMHDLYIKLCLLLYFAPWH